MTARYVLALDQSTQATKAMLFDETAALTARADAPHRQIITPEGWVEHDPQEILRNTLATARAVVQKAGIDPAQIAAVGLSNQRETVAAWNAATGQPLCNAIVWQCARGREICADLKAVDPQVGDTVRQKTGIPLSPYFSAPKLAWVMRHIPAAAACADAGTLRLGTMDSFLIWQLCQGHPFKTDYSNASRTQLFNLHTLAWDAALCHLYGVPQTALPQVCMSDSEFGLTTLGGLLPAPVPLHGVLGDSHAALLGQGCRAPGQVKATYGTGSSVMLQTGPRLVQSASGLVTSLAWGLNGRVEYVLEGNLNYTGAVIAWLKNEVGLLQTDAECETLARAANPQDTAYFVPAFTGLGAPYWASGATGLFTGITRTTGRAELVRACVDCIAYQIADLLRCMAQDAALPPAELRVDGGPTANRYLMQRQSDLAAVAVCVPPIQELSGLGAALAAGTGCGLYAPGLPTPAPRARYTPAMPAPARAQRLQGWQRAVKQALAGETPNETK